MRIGIKGHSYRDKGAENINRLQLGSLRSFFLLIPYNLSLDSSIQ